MADELTQGQDANLPLDLDIEPESEPRRTIKLGGRIYTMQRAIDLSMAEQEDWRLIQVQIVDIARTPAGEDGYPSQVQRDVLEDLELRLCALVLDTPYDDLPRELLAGEEQAWRRNLLLEAFVQQPGTAQRLLTAASPVMRQAAATMRQSTTSASPARLAPLRQPASGTRKSRRGSSSATAAG